LRLKLRDRLHRARLDRRTQNENPLATGADPDAPDWFEPEIGGDNGANEVTIATAPKAGERSEERKIVHMDDLSPEDDVRGGATTADADSELEIIEASRESDDTDEPQFDGDIPGFTDWREELRERLKRIRARREQERLAAEAAAEEPLAAAAVEATEEVAEDAPEELVVEGEPAELAAEVETVTEEAEEPAEAIDVAEEPIADLAIAAAEPQEPIRATAGDLIAQIIDGPSLVPPIATEADVDLAQPDVPDAEVDFTMEIEAPDVALDLDGAGPSAADSLDALIIGEKEVAPQVEPEENLALSATIDEAEEPVVDFDDVAVEAIEEPVDEAANVAVEAIEKSVDEADDVAVEAVDEADELAPDEEATDENTDAPVGLKLVEDPVDDVAGMELVEDPVDDVAGMELVEDPVDDVAGMELVEEFLNDAAASENLEIVEEPAAAVLESVPEATADAPEDADYDASEADTAEIAVPSDSFDWGEATDKDADAEDIDEIFAAAAEPRDELDEILTGDEAAPEELDEIRVADPESQEELDEIFAVDTEAHGEPPELPAEEHADVVAAADAEDLAAETELPAAIMPQLPTPDGVPELDFEPAVAAMVDPAPEIDLPEEVETGEDLALEWDSNAASAAAAPMSSAAPLGERAAAGLCDTLVLTAIGVALVGAASSGTGLPFRQILAQEALFLGLAWAIFAVGYSVFFVGSCGQTIGRMVMRLRVVGDNQFSVGFDRAAIRLAAWVVSAAPLFAGMLLALRDPQKRALHDRVSHTRVVKA